MLAARVGYRDGVGLPECNIIGGLTMTIVLQETVYQPPGGGSSGRCVGGDLADIEKDDQLDIAV
jgi:hypothetical protein